MNGGRGLGYIMGIVTGVSIAVSVFLYRENKNLKQQKDEKPEAD